MSFTFHNSSDGSPFSPADSITSLSLTIKTISWKPHMIRQFQRSWELGFFPFVSYPNCRRISSGLVWSTILIRDEGSVFFFLFYGGGEDKAKLKAKRQELMTLFNLYLCTTPLEFTSFLEGTDNSCATSFTTPL